MPELTTSDVVSVLKTAINDLLKLLGIEKEISIQTKNIELPSVIEGKQFPISTFQLDNVPEIEVMGQRFAKEIKMCGYCQGTSHTDGPQWDRYTTDTSQHPYIEIISSSGQSLIKITGKTQQELLNQLMNILVLSKQKVRPETGNNLEILTKRILEICENLQDHLLPKPQDT